MGLPTKAQIGRCGELLDQYELLLLGIESAPLSTDAGIDLVAYSPGKQEAGTIQVKANHKPKPSGGKGRAAFDWWVPESNPAQAVALVDLSTRSVACGWRQVHPRTGHQTGHATGWRPRRVTIMAKTKT